jgi:hypothetical protein
VLYWVTHTSHGRSCLDNFSYAKKIPPPIDVGQFFYVNPSAHLEQHPFILYDKVLNYVRKATALFIESCWLHLPPKVDDHAALAVH